MAGRKKNPEGNIRQRLTPEEMREYNRLAQRKHRAKFYVPKPKKEKTYFPKPRSEALSRKLFGINVVDMNEEQRRTYNREKARLYRQKLKEKKLNQEKSTTEV